MASFGDAPSLQNPSLKASRWFFVFGFEKNERENVSANEPEALQTLASELLALSGPQLGIAVEDGALQEICHEC